MPLPDNQNFKWNSETSVAVFGENPLRHFFAGLINVLHCCFGITLMILLIFM